MRKYYIIEPSEVQAAYMATWPDDAFMCIVTYMDSIAPRWCYDVVHIGSMNLDPLKTLRLYGGQGMPMSTVTSHPWDQIRVRLLQDPNYLAPFEVNAYGFPVREEVTQPTIKRDIPCRQCQRPTSEGDAKCWFCTCPQPGNFALNSKKGWAA